MSVSEQFSSLQISPNVYNNLKVIKMAESVEIESEKLYNERKKSGDASDVKKQPQRSVLTNMRAKALFFFWSDYGDTWTEGGRYKKYPNLHSRSCRRWIRKY